jgi:RNA recognition motif-containing protein
MYVLHYRHFLRTTNPRPNREVNLTLSQLPLDYQWQDLKDLFRTSGNIIRADINTQPDGKLRGFGIVVLSTEAEAEKAVETFNG